MLRLSHLRKSFGSNVAVDDLSIELRRGEIFGLLGPNGAGKTTTLHMTVGLLTPDAGLVEMEGGRPTDPAIRARIGVAPQSLALYDDLSALENLDFFGRIHHLTGSLLRDRVAWCLEFAGLTDRRKDRVKTYSGGMKRRLNLAVAMVHDPPLLLLDEPTVGVDPQSRNLIFERILDLKKLGRTVVYTTHYMEEAQRLCDRVGIMDRGQLLALDTVDRLIAAHGGRSVVTVERADGETRVETDDPVAELMRLRHQDGMLRFRVDSPDLERVFLNLTGRHLRD
jgi:ABC-2 type transport system ATP-binding protein